MGPSGQNLQYFIERDFAAYYGKPSSSLRSDPFLQLLSSQVPSTSGRSAGLLGAKTGALSQLLSSVPPRAIRAIDPFFAPYGTTTAESSDRNRNSNFVEPPTPDFLASSNGRYMPAAHFAPENASESLAGRDFDDDTRTGVMAPAVNPIPPLAQAIDLLGPLPGLFSDTGDCTAGGTAAGLSVPIGFPLRLAQSHSNPSQTSDLSIVSMQASDGSSGSWAGAAPVLKIELGNEHWLLAKIAERLAKCVATPSSPTVPTLNRTLDSVRSCLSAALQG